jgi:hypothetical protein
MTLSDPPSSLFPRGFRLSRQAAQAIALLVAAALAYAIWRGYQNPDFLLGLSAWRLC